jgi:hypothetical protein
MDTDTNLIVVILTALTGAIGVLWKDSRDGRLKCEETNKRIFDKLEVQASELGYLKGVVSVLNSPATTNTNTVNTTDSPHTN